MSSTHTLVMSADQAHVCLDVFEGPHQGERYVIDRPDAVLVGRATEAELCLERDPHFSRNHFRLTANPPDCVLLDLGSLNGTFVNDERVQEVLLKNGDIISGGDTQIRVTTFVPSTGESIAVARPARTADLPELKMGERLGSYEILRELGRGTMGIVYLSRHARTGRETAVKVLPAGPQQTPQSLQLFLREASVLSQLDHPRIVRFYEFGLVEHRLFLAMEYVPVVSLDELTESERARGAVHVICGLFGQLLDALAHAHLHGLVHRDIKPGNLLVARHGKRVALKLADFGLAKNYWNAGCSGVTGMGALRGTLPYMAPEQILRCRDARPACDIYSAGATLYWMLSGVAPFTETTAGQTVKAVLETMPPGLATLRPALPTELVRLVERAMAKDPADRFASAQEFRVALEPFLVSRRG